MRRLKTLALVATFVTSSLAGQAPPPPPQHPAPPGPPPAPAPPEGPIPPLTPGGIAGVQRKLSEVRSTSPTTEKILKLARLYLSRGEQAAGSKDFTRNRDVAAADALVHAAEHQQHLLDKEAANKTAPPLPPGPPPLPLAEDITRHLDHLYFRLQQANFFVAQSGDPNAALIAGFARRYYQEARAASDQSDHRVADECAKSADDLMRALENLAQTAAQPLPPPPPQD